IEELVNDRETQATSHALSLNQSDLRLETVAPTDFIDSGIKETFRLRTRTGREIVATANHPFLTINGWRELQHLRVGQEIAVPRRLDAFGVDELPDAEVALLAYLIGDGS
ncbi:MAG: replicative DNA helicase, partial [Gammaproteobacteria bacterium]|nr:replicative DNA helicase [Gammaproteobacteria bacterium]